MGEQAAEVVSDFGTDVIDVSGLRLGELADVDQSVLDRILDRLAVTDSGAVAGFTSSL